VIPPFSGRRRPTPDDRGPRGYGLLHDDDLPAASADGGTRTATRGVDGDGSAPGPTADSPPTALSAAASDGLPYYRFGSGDRPLVVVPGANDAFVGADRRRAGGTLARATYRRFARDYDVWVVSRPDGLAPGTTTREMAADYARVVRHVGAPADVLGVSMGGLIAAHLAADAPALVDRLVCAVSGVRLGDDGRESVERWRDLAAAGRWRDLAIDTAGETYGAVRGWTYGATLAAVPDAALAPAVPTDPGVSFRACLDHDGADALDRVEAPTLVVGGADDALFPAPLQREAAARADADLELIRWTGHGAIEERKATFDRAVASFLDR
jgi:pimeloyl-ACP methyl ester carboxylesterase